jgi:hypothetical protein
MMKKMQFVRRRKVSYLLACNGNYASDTHRVRSE